MDHIRKAILKAKASRKAPAGDLALVTRRPRAAPSSEAVEAEDARPHYSFPLLAPDAQILEANRIVAHQPQSPASVSFDVLRTRVYQAMQQAGMRTLIITSPNPSSGKTVTAINLAISLARQPGCLTVLLDCDFRRPRVAKYLGLKPEVDLLDVLSGRSSIGEALRGLTPTGQGLGILPTRRPAARPSEILSSQDMREVVAAIKSQSADILVILDVAPMLVADDVLAILPDVDGVLLVVASDETHYGDVDACLRSIPKEKLVGVAIAKSREASEHSFYGNY